MIRMIKTAISIPREDFNLIESLRKKLGKSRSQILVEAFRAWVNTRRKKELETRYAEAYQKNPEDIAELDAYMKASLDVLNKEDW